MILKRTHLTYRDESVFQLSSEEVSHDDIFGLHYDPHDSTYLISDQLNGLFVRRSG